MFKADHLHLCLSFTPYPFTTYALPSQFPFEMTSSQKGVKVQPESADGVKTHWTCPGLKDEGGAGVDRK